MCNVHRSRTFYLHTLYNVYYLHRKTVYIPEPEILGNRNIEFN